MLQQLGLGKLVRVRVRVTVRVLTLTPTLTLTERLYDNNGSGYVTVGLLGWLVWLGLG